MDVETIQENWGLVGELSLTYGLPFLTAILILILGFWFASFAQRLATNSMSKTGRIDETVARFLGSVVKYVLIAVTVLAVLDEFGVETTSLVALLGAAGLTVGLALQGTLSNVAAGVMLLIFRPFKIGQFVEVGGVSGTVGDITLFTTHLNRGDNVHVIVPNSEIWGAPIQNFSHNETRRIEMVVGVGYDDDLDRVLEVTKSVIEADKRALRDPAPLVAVSELGASSVDLIIRVWCKSGDFSTLKWDMTKAIKEAYDREGISIPYPHMVVQTLRG